MFLGALIGIIYLVQNTADESKRIIIAGALTGHQEQRLESLQKLKFATTEGRGHRALQA